jgi:hypothetical protein
MAMMVVGGLLVLVGMIINEVLRRYDENSGKAQLPEIKSKKKNKKGATHA